MSLHFTFNQDQPATAGSRPKVTAWAIVSLTFGGLGFLIIISFFIPGMPAIYEIYLPEIVPLYLVGIAFISAIVAIVSGYLARKRIRRSQSVLKGSGLALTGLIFGGIPVLIIFLSFLLPTTGGTPREKIYGVNCYSNLKQIGLACTMYADDNDGQFPPDFVGLVKERYLDAFKIYMCPATQNRPAENLDEFARGGHCDYLYFGQNLRVSKKDAGTTILAADKPGNHPTFHNFVFADGHVVQMKGRSFEEIVKKNGFILPVLKSH